MSLSISVICAAWQAAETLAETVASVRSQLLVPAEIVVVDDGSTDETAAVGRAAGATVIERPHRGPAAALNDGLAASRGDLIAFIDADDLWPAEKLAMQARLLDADPTLAGVLGHMRSFVSPDVKPEVAALYWVPKDSQPAWMLSALLAPRRTLTDVGPFDEEIRAGYAIDWFDRARHRSLSFAIPDEVVLLRRIRPATLSHRSPVRDAGYALMAKRAIERRRTSDKTD